jgi:hypothetical protein
VDLALALNGASKAPVQVLRLEELLLPVERLGFERTFRARAAGRLISLRAAQQQDGACLSASRCLFWPVEPGNLDPHLPLLYLADVFYSSYLAIHRHLARENVPPLGTMSLLQCCSRGCK